MDKIKQAFRDNSGVKIYFEDGDEKLINAEPICGGITWATSKPFYCCFLGKAYLDDKSEDYKIHLLDEIESDLPGLFHESFAKCSLRPHCRKFFAVIDKVTWDHYIDFKDYLKSRNLERRTDISRTRTSNFANGIRIVQELNAQNKISIPLKSILGKQLLRMTEDDIAGANCPESLYAVKAFTNAVKYFFEPPVINPPVMKPNYRYHE